MSVEQPRWKTPEYRISQIDAAGDIERCSESTEQDQLNARRIIDNWRSAHAYPLHVFYMNLKRKAGSRSDVLVVERLKRMKSISGKLQREKRMRLSRMQDLGGCRMVLPTLEDVYKYSKKFQDSRIRHEWKKTNDYIKYPKPTGYRSLHLIYRFVTDTPEKKIYNQYPMLIELQFRTHLQHIWATALETIGIVTNQALKAGEGSKDLLRFFALVSSLFAIKEGCPVVPNTSDNTEILIAEMRQINSQHHALDTLRAIRAVIEHDSGSVPDKRGYYILQLDYEKRTLKRWFFKPSELEMANKIYDYLEEKRGDAPLDIVLIRAASYATVKAAYPNYFMDIGEFVDIVSGYLK